LSEITDLTDDGAWCWFQDPRAVHHVGQRDRTYVGYVTSTGDVAVLAVDHAGAIARTTLHPGYERDDHASPALLVLPDGRIAAFYSGHSGRAMNYRVSERPEDISRFGPELSIGVNTAPDGVYTYANPFYLSAESRVYLFFRSGTYKPGFTYSDDGLRTWAPAQVAIESPSRRPYVKYASNGADSVYLAFTEGHPNEFGDNSIYCAKFSQGRFTDAAGADLGAAPIDTASLTKIYDGSSAGGRGWVHSIALDAQGRPSIVFAAFPRRNDPGYSGEDHRYHYAAFTGGEWVEREFAPAGRSMATTDHEPEYTGGATQDPHDPGTVYLSRETGAGWNIERWHTDDFGATFDEPTLLTTDGDEADHKNIRPVVPWGAPGGPSVLWMQGRYDHWRDGYRTRLLALG
jgi:hypothetical protein